MPPPTGRPNDRPGRNDQAFNAIGEVDGWISAQDCAAAGLHDLTTWGKVQAMTVGDLMLLSGFHEKGNPYRSLPELEKPEQAAIINALERHLEMNYIEDKHEYGFGACCCCIG